jgi:hypothetical protein
MDMVIALPILIIVSTLDNSLKDALNGIDPKTYLRVVCGTFYQEEELPKGSKQTCLRRNFMYALPSNFIDMDSSLDSSY